MPMLIAVFLAAAWLAYSNGANDNMKGVATLLGSGTSGYRGALSWGTAMTLAGSLSALLLAGRLLEAFSGRGIVSAAATGNPAFLVAVGLGAAAAVSVATLRGLPVSTTHALVGGLAGAGIALAGPGAVLWPALGRSFLVPLLLSPLLAAGLVSLVYPLLHRARLRMGVEEDTCLCVGAEPAIVLPPRAGAGGVGPLADGVPAAAMAGVSATPLAEAVTVSTAIGVSEECASRYGGRLLGIDAQRILDGLHYLSAGAVSFARGLNDTPKIAALLLAGSVVHGHQAAMAIIGAGMATGALLHARRTGETLSFEITPMNSGQGFTANLTTAALVIGASRLGVPVSTTHVSVGALFGLGASSRRLVRSTLRRILFAWLVTLPAGLALAWLVGLLIG